MRRRSQTPHRFGKIAHRYLLAVAENQRRRNALRELGVICNGAIIALVCLDLTLRSQDLPMLQESLEKLIKEHGLRQ
jgi:hypothetical protein